MRRRRRRLADPLADTQSAPPADPVAGLIDIPLPPEVTLWPQTWPSRIALALLLAGIIIATLRSIRNWRANRYRREALAELKEITRLPSNELEMQLSLLVRR